ncbi:unnamed protein product [Sphagnum jensenii]|uniref:Uncharacterized protein n=1 Tax=Sphagnum jensenii TaxID=128206 RepID=A0ABP0VKC0_9BRYO
MQRAKTHTTIAARRADFQHRYLQELDQYATGEYTSGETKGHPVGTDINVNIKKKFLLLEQKDSAAVVAFRFDGPDSIGLDGYLFFKKEGIWKLGNAKLTLASDEAIIAHFNTHKVDFEQLRHKVLDRLQSTKPESRDTLNIASEVKPDLRRLLIQSVHTGQNGCEECMEFLIGGVLDNTVGYYYFTDKKYVPAMSPDRLIMLREIGHGWYVFKTT